MKAIPSIVNKDGAWKLMADGKPMILLAGEVHNSSSSSLSYMEQVWEQGKKLGMNCLLLPVTWELLEPEEGHFDFSLVDGLIMQARQHEMKISFLWFGTWKNAQSTYAPEWVKKDTKRFKRAQLEKGKSFVRVKKFYDLAYSPLTYLCEETMHADARAFAALMAEIRRADGEEHTVVTVQVENETGIMAAARDHSDEADALFYAPVPADFASYMQRHTDTMVPSVREAVENGKESGSWQDMFGDQAEELFSAYYTARYVNTVAEAGKREYPLPMTVNCWLNREGASAGSYPSGGPISKVREVWNFCAPNIDIYGPDIYLPDFQGICKEYTRRGEPLCIPECPTHSCAASRNLYCIGKFHCICYSPFGIEDMGRPLDPAQMALFGADASDPALMTSQDVETYSLINHLLEGMMDRLLSSYGTDRLDAAAGEFGPESAFHMDGVQIRAKFTGKEGGCLILRESEQEFFILAYKTWLHFISDCKDAQGIDLLAFEEGHFENGNWHRGRRLNGDEVVANTFTAEEPVLLRVKLFTFA